MPKKISKNELNIIVNIVTQFPEGISLGKIMEKKLALAPISK